MENVKCPYYISLNMVDNCKVVHHLLLCEDCDGKGLLNGKSVEELRKEIKKRDMTEVLHNNFNDSLFTSKIDSKKRPIWGKKICGP